MQIIPLSATESQSLLVQVNGQSTQLNVYQKFYGVFMDVYLEGTLVIGGVLCLNLNLIIRSQYLGFSGDFAFYDTQGDADPTYSGLGSRYKLIYCLPSDLQAGQY